MVLMEQHQGVEGVEVTIEEQIKEEMEL